MPDTRTDHLTHIAHLAVVAIGRNEGERLVRCLQSLRGRAGLVVYVDSGSTDGSLEVARSSGAEVVELDMSSPFTAARARNAGLSRALECRPDLAFVQFVDGDCEVVPGWLEAACGFLVEHPRAAVASGLRRERYPERSVYNLLCDLDWNPPTAGIVKSCGGDAMMRVTALEAVGRYRPDLVAGEEPELCVRLRAAGWEIHALGVPMTLHDAAMTRFAQWWMRTLRTGYAYAQGVWLHGAPPERHCVRPLRSAVAWGLALPASIVALMVLDPRAAVLALAYPLQMLRLGWRSEGPARTRCARGVFLVLGKFPESQGCLRFWRQRLQGRTARLIEYK